MSNDYTPDDILSVLIKAYFDEHQWHYEEQRDELCEGSLPIRKFWLNFTRQGEELQRVEIYVVDNICHFVVYYTEIHQCPIDKVSEVCRTIAEINSSRWFFTWKYNPSTNVISSEYRYAVPPDAYDRGRITEKEFGAYFERIDYNELEDDIIRIKQAMGLGSNSNSIKFNL